jgi:A/G-specific adenine glycosylase
MWNGLGYYRRAANLHAAARMITRRFRGRVPSTVADLLQLPGVGRYTAGAIASIIYRKPEPIVDGNVGRVLSRLFADAIPRSHRERSAWTWTRASELVSQAPNPGVFNEALMELGAVVCTPRSPRCDACPLSRRCQARRRGVESIEPPSTNRKQPRRVHHHCVIVMRDGKLLLHRRPDSGMWAAMWQTPSIESDQALSDDQIKTRLTISACRMRKLGAFDHHTSHRRITFHVYSASSHSRGGVWKRASDLDALPMSNAHRRVLEYRA